MRFMMLMIPKGYEKATPGAMPDAKAVAAMMKYNEELQKAGRAAGRSTACTALDGRARLVPGGSPSDRRAFRRGEGGARRLLDDQVKSKEEASKWAKRCPASENEVIEIRQVKSSRTSGRRAGGRGRLSRDAGPSGQRQRVVTRPGARLGLHGRVKEV